jgi:peptidoglycan hydrolase-like protein with peptidoglycan-binding domain
MNGAQANAIGFDASKPLSDFVGGLAAANVSFVGRYVASDPDQAWKIITPSEAVELAIAGVPVFPIYENLEKTQSGTAAGNADGAYAATYLPTVGLLPNTGVIVYYCEDYNVFATDMPGISDAFKAFGASLPGYGIGVYSCGLCNGQLSAQGLVGKQWLSGSTSYNGTPQATAAGNYDMIQGVPKNITINNRIINVDIDTIRVADADIGARVPWGGAIPQDAPLSIVAIQMLLNKAGQTPPLDPDDVSGNLTRQAIIASKQKYGLPADTSIDWVGWVPLLCRDAGVRIWSPPAPPVAIAMDTVAARLTRLEQTVGSTDMASTAAPDPNALQLADKLQKAIDALPKAAPGAGTTTPPSSLGEVNGALGDTLGNILNGKKSAIGIIGAMLTSMLSQVPPGSGLGQVLSNLTPSNGLSPYAMPIFLALTVWGVLGKMEKWSDQTPPPQS